MLDKPHNSVVTLAIFLALVGVSKPAKAFLLAQADVTSKTFTVPERLPEKAAVKVLASNSTASINQSLKEGFTAKYPQATVNLKTQNSEAALKALSEGKADLVAIGRNLTAAEQQQGLVAVPISREKIAIVISQDNPYDGNLTISEFAKIFRGEITDWSEIGGNAGPISLVDAPDTNDTRQAFPNYPVFQEGEFATGSNAVKLDQDTTDATISQLGENGISYAVANDVINRDDVKIVTMHQTQPDDPRYPFSQPFYLVYQETPSEATEAFLGFATTKPGEKVVANRVGSVSTAAAGAIASKLGNKPADAPSGSVDLPETTVDGEGEIVEPETINEVPDGETNPDTVAENETVDAETDSDVVAGVETNDTNPNNGEVDSELDGSGEVNPKLNGSGEVDSELNGSGEVNPKLNGSGEVNSELDGSGEVNPELDGSGEPNATTDSENSETTVPSEVEGDGTVATEREGKWWWWLPLIIGIPVLALVALSGFGRGKKSDREPAISDIPNANFPDDDGGIPVRPDEGNLSAVGTGVATNEGSVTSSTSGMNSSRLGGEALASGTAMAGGVAATNLVGKKKTVEDEVELFNAETDDRIDEIPSNPVTEFTDRETDLQTTNQPTKIQTDVTEQKTKLQTTDQSTTIQTDPAEDLDNTDSGFADGISTPPNTVAGGAAALGGAAAVSSFLNDRENTSEETVESPVFESENPTLLQTDSVWDRANTLQAEDDVDIDSDATNKSQEFDGDFVLDEETTSELSQGLETKTSIETSDIDFKTNVDSSIDSSTDATSGVLDSAALGGAGLSGVAATPDLFTSRDSQDTSDISEVDLDTSAELSNSDGFADNVIADAETTSDDLDLEGTSLDNTESSTDINLEEITFDDVDNSTDSFIDDLDIDSKQKNIDINDLGFEESTDSSASNSLSIDPAEITDISNDNSDDMNDISAWLDSLETPNQSSEDISEWLDRLSVDEDPSRSQKERNDISKTEVESSDDIEDISFQFLEDLLERDSQKNQDG